MVTYLYYKETYGGAEIPEEEFSRWAVQAARRLSADTAGRTDAVLAQGEAAALYEAVCRAVCEVAEILYAAHAAQARSAGLAAEKVGDWSRTYCPPEDSAADRRVYTAEVRCLGTTGLLFRGWPA